jgi:hypothetical protein
MGSLLWCAALCALADDELTEPVSLDQLPKFYEARAAAGLRPRKPMLIFGAKMKVGQVGIIPEGSFPEEKNAFYKVRIVQVLEQRFLAEFVTYRWVTVIVGEGALARVGGERIEEARRDTLIVQGIDTTDAVDDKPIALAGDWSVARTESYNTVAGASRTVFVLEPIDLPKPPEAAPPKAPVVGKDPEERDTEKAAPEPKAPVVRTWRDASGKFSIEAEFRGVAAGAVRLRTKEGRTITVPLEKLSAGDREWIRDRR